MLILFFCYLMVFWCFVVMILFVSFGVLVVQVQIECEIFGLCVGIDEIVLQSNGCIVLVMVVFVEQECIVLFILGY